MATWVRPLYVASTGAVLVAVIRNVRIPGMALVAVGAGANLAAIVANGGFMPASEAAFAALGGGLNAGYTNSSIVANPALEPLTDAYSLPTWLPFANVFSVGDVLIAIGVAIVIVSAMRSGRVTGHRSAGPIPAAEAPAPAPSSPRRSFMGWRIHAPAPSAVVGAGRAELQRSLNGTGPSGAVDARGKPARLPEPPRPNGPGKRNARPCCSIWMVRTAEKSPSS